MINQIPLIASVLLALFAGCFAWTLSNLAVEPSASNSGATKLEIERRRSLRSGISTYRRAELLIGELAALNRSFVDTHQIDKLNIALQLTDRTTPWKAEEFIACKEVEGAVAGGIVAVISLLQVNVLTSVIIGLCVAGFFVYSSIQQIHQTATSRVNAIKRRLPFAVDLIALMLEAGASFQEALKTAVRENGAHPLGEELGIVVSQTELGRPRRLALDGLRVRLKDHDVDDLIVAINKGEELGTPLSTIMRTQADQMRLKRSQWGEKAAAEAQVQMTFPAMVIMLACMLLILGPFLLPLLQML